jgi:excinuclease ABC subunit B
MAKPPDSKKPKDPARPTRAKAAREPLAPIAPHLEKLLNPGIAKGTAGVGSQTGLGDAGKPAKRANAPLPGGDGVKEKGPKTGLQPPADNSWDRREDFSAAHRARKSVSSPLPSPPPASGRLRPSSTGYARP